MSESNQVTSLIGKAVVITGGTTGIGRAAAALLVAQGARVLIFGREEQALQEALSDIGGQAQSGGEIHGLTADQSKHEDVARVFAEADQRLGGVDILVNNAAQAAGSILDSDYAEWAFVVQTNVLGYMACCREAVDRMKARGGGHIVNVGSLSAKIREEGSDVYVATKAAIEGFSESLRKQVNGQGVKVTLIEPGLVGTDMTASNTPPPEQPQKEQEGQMLTAEDLARSVLYALQQPARCDVILIQIRPHGQAI